MRCEWSPRKVSIWKQVVKDDLEFLPPLEFPVHIGWPQLIWGAPLWASCYILDPCFLGCQRQLPCGRVRGDRSGTEAYRAWVNSQVVASGPRIRIGTGDLQLLGAKGPPWFQRKRVTKSGVGEGWKAGVLILVPVLSLTFPVTWCESWWSLSLSFSSSGWRIVQSLGVPVLSSLMSQQPQTLPSPLRSPPQQGIHWDQPPEETAQPQRWKIYLIWKVRTLLLPFSAPSGRLSGNQLASIYFF
jgi:hypothetical protein